MDSLQLAKHFTDTLCKAKEILLREPTMMEAIQPYLKYILFLMWIIGFIWVNRIFIKDPKLRAWLLNSLEEKEGRASGKSLTAFMFAQIVALASLVSIVYAKDHLIPEYVLYSLLMFMASVYGIKLAGKFADKNQTSSSTTSTTSIIEEKSSSKSEEKKDENKEEPII